MDLRGWKLWVARGLALSVIAGAIVAIEARQKSDTEPPPTPAATPRPDVRPTGAPAPAAPEVRGISAWINSEPLTLVSLRGKVVLVDFWAFSCINCIRTVPYLRDWHAKYSPRGLVVLGLHAPEFDFERSEANVREAVVRQGITWPVGLDNDFATWNAYGNRYWPRKYLIDREGLVRYDRIGEGGYADTEQWIRRLLEEAGAKVDDIPMGAAGDPASSSAVTRELYAGSAWSGGGYLGNPPASTSGNIGTFEDGGSRSDGKIYLDGQWEVRRDSVRSVASGIDTDAYVAIRYTAATVNAVAQADAIGSPVRVVVTLAGLPLPEAMRGDDVLVDERGATYFDVGEARLYNVVRGESVVTRDLELRVRLEGFSLYTFTFGSQGKP
jgi:thiol-disulfide isomerase/thioredoxin